MQDIKQTKKEGGGAERKGKRKKGVHRVEHKTWLVEQAGSGHCVNIDYVILNTRRGDNKRCRIYKRKREKKGGGGG